MAHPSRVTPRSFLTVGSTAIALIAVALTLMAATASASPAASAAVKPYTAGQVTFTFVNNMNQTVWPASQGNSGQLTPNGGGWQMAPGSTMSITVPGTWSGRFWGRTGCSFNASGVGSCQTGDCAGLLACNGAGGQTPASLAEMTLLGGAGNDVYDVSFVDGFNVPITVIPIGGTPNPSDPYHCTDAGCGVNLNTNCPTVLQVHNAQGATIACKSACSEFGTDQYCCAGQYASPTTCIPSQWPVDYAAYFKTACPHAYSYAFDDPTSLFNCTNCNYEIVFGPLTNSSPSPPTNLASPSQTDSSVSLTWTASTDPSSDVTGYEIFRNGTEVGTSTTNTYTDTGLSPSTSYAYTVKAYDSSGDLSDPSNLLTVSTAAVPSGPTAPTNLASPSQTSSSISLTWSPSTDPLGIAGYRIFRNGTQIGTSTTNSYTDTGLAASTTYGYTVEAYDSVGNVSAPSNLLTISTSATTNTCAGFGLFLRSSGALCTYPGTSGTTVTIPAAGGANYDGAPHNPVTFTVTGINGIYNGGVTAFYIYLDSGYAVANGIQARISYDFNGSGNWQRVETYHYFATNNLPGWEQYNQSAGLESVTGSNFQNFTNGSIQLQLWSAIGTASSIVSVDSTAAQGSQSIVYIPY